jgi:hypothetical protein
MVTRTATLITRVGEAGRETMEEVTVHTKSLSHALTPACNNLDGNRLASETGELAAGHPAAGCFHSN